MAEIPAMNSSAARNPLYMQKRAYGLGMTSRHTADQVADLMSDATDLGSATLCGDIDEARFLTHRMSVKAIRAGLIEVAITAEQLSTALGPIGTTPGPGYGTQLMALAEALRRSGGLPPLPSR